jgi:hypothetical protein
LKSRSADALVFWPRRALACHSCNICKFFKSCRAKVQIAR